MKLRSLLFPVSAASFWVAAPSLARAETAIGVDGDLAIPTTPHALVSSGAGFDVRVGEQLHLPAIRIGVEAGYGYTHLAADLSPSDWTLNRFFGGVRLQLGELLIPYAFAHLGYGWRSTPDHTYNGGGTSFDGGIGLDLNIWVVSFGLHAGYGYIDANPVAPQWVLLGLDAAVAF